MSTRLIELALKGLETERASIDREIAGLRQQLNGAGPAAEPVSAPIQRRGRRGLTPAGRKKLSEMMKARWAARRKTAAKK